VACAAVGGELDAALLRRCSAALTTCGFEDPFTATCGTPPGEPGWPAAYLRRHQTCVAESSERTRGSIACFPGDPCPPTAAPERALLGTSGPQPSTGACPDCQVVRRSRREAELVLELSETLPRTTRISSPMLVVSFDGGGRKAFPLSPPLALE